MRGFLGKGRGGMNLGKTFFVLVLSLPLMPWGSVHPSEDFKRVVYDEKSAYVIQLKAPKHQPVPSHLPEVHPVILLCGSWVTADSPFSWEGFSMIHA